jgi:TRAP-type C4-dicarboxylate transport system permease small subunit
MNTIATMLAQGAVPKGVPTKTPDFSVSVTPPDAFYVDFGDMLTNVMNIVVVIGVVAVLLYLIWGGIEWITSGGDKGKTESARNKITAAIVGLIILISAWAILMFVQQILGIKVL